MNTSLPVIAGVEITTDEHGRFNLNALHKASGGLENKAPAQWLRKKSVKELNDELIDQTMQICTVKSDEGRYGGTFAHEILAVAYAAWISPAFHIKVIQTFLDYRKGTSDDRFTSHAEKIQLLKKMGLLTPSAAKEAAMHLLGVAMNGSTDPTIIAEQKQKYISNKPAYLQAGPRTPKHSGMPFMGLSDQGCELQHLSGYHVGGIDGLLFDLNELGLTDPYGSPTALGYEKIFIAPEPYTVPKVKAITTLKLIGVFPQ